MLTSPFLLRIPKCKEGLMQKRILDVAVISDVHLGTFGAHAKELYTYLKSIRPKVLVLNGDIIDIWNFRKSYFPKSHMKVLRQILHLATKGTKVYYITGNHDELLRKFCDAEFGNITLTNKLLLKVGDETAWIFHGDVFDASIQNAKFIAKLGGWGYDLLILLNRMVNWFLVKAGKEKFSLSKKIKNSVKKAVKYISDFENTASELAIEKGYDYVICGHIHQPQMKTVKTDKGEVVYLNSGDWVENLSSLEYNNGKWDVFLFEDAAIEEEQIDEPTLPMTQKELYELVIPLIEPDAA